MPRISLSDIQTARRPLAVATVIAIVIGLVLAFQIALPPKLRHHSIGLATQSGLVDTSRSQLGRLGSPTNDQTTALAFRASLLASLMTTPSFERSIARRAGIPASELQIIPDVTVAPATPATTVVPKAPGQSPRANKVTITVPSLAAGQLPILQVITQAKTPSVAAALAQSTIAVARANVQSASGQGVSSSNRLVIRSLGPAASGWQGTGLSPILALLIAIVVFLIEAAGILFLRVRRADAEIGGSDGGQLAVTSGPPQPDTPRITGTSTIRASLTAPRRKN